MMGELGNVSEREFAWPEGKRAAISPSFDDARASQLGRGLPILDAYGVKATFYVSILKLEGRLDGWRRALVNGHEIGNHTATHPCSGNFGFARGNALENLTLDRMEDELTEANDLIESMLGIVPATFAYPCGQTYVGRGEWVKSYVPLVAKHFMVGRCAFNETHNHPAFCDLAQAWSLDADDATFEKVKRWIDNALAVGGWLILMGHDVGDGGRQVMRSETLEAVCRYATDPANGLWIDTVAAIGGYIAQAQDVGAQCAGSEWKGHA